MKVIVKTSEMGLNEARKFKKTENLCGVGARNGLNKKMKFVG